MLFVEWLIFKKHTCVWTFAKVDTFSAACLTRMPHGSCTGFGAAQAWAECLSVIAYWLCGLRPLTQPPGNEFFTISRNHNIHCLFGIVAEPECSCSLLFLLNQGFVMMAEVVLWEFWGRTIHSDPSSTGGQGTFDFGIQPAGCEEAWADAGPTQPLVFQWVRLLRPRHSSPWLLSPQSAQWKLQASGADISTVLCANIPTHRNRER